MYVGALTLDVLLGDVRSLKQKRSAVAAIVAEVRRRQPGVAVAETGSLDRYRRAEIGVAVVSSMVWPVCEKSPPCWVALGTVSLIGLGLPRLTVCW